MSTLASDNGWNNLPWIIFYDIMLMIGQESLENIYNCGQVCKSWYKMTVTNDILIVKSFFNNVCF